jgi:beta-N-acetylhexosaminidase
LGRCGSILLAVLLAAGVGACGGGTESGSPATPEAGTGASASTPATDPAGSPATEPPASETEATTTSDSCASRLPVEQSVDRIPLVLVTAGTDLTAMVDHVGGIGLIGNHGAASVTSIRAQLDEAAVPPLLASDEEGGRVQRLESALGPLPPAADVTDLPLAEARDTYRRYADDLAGVGVDVNFAPVLATGGGALGDRSYGDDPGVVAERAGLFIDAMHDAGVLPVVKHFPGLGQVEVNTDVGVAIGPPLEQLQALDLVPYERLLSRRPLGVMVSHIRVPDLTGDRPASLAPATYDLLRDSYGFDGLVVTDSLSAEAVTTGWSVPDAAVEAIGAGADMVLFKDPTLLEGVRSALLEAVDDGRLPVSRVREAAAAVLGVQGIDPCTLVEHRR